MEPGAVPCPATRPSHLPRAFLLTVEQPEIACPYNLICSSHSHVISRSYTLATCLSCFPLQTVQKLGERMMRGLSCPLWNTSSGAVREILERLNEPAAGPADGDADTWSDERGSIAFVSSLGYSSWAMHDKLLCKGMFAIQQIEKIMGLLSVP